MTEKIVTLPRCGKCADGKHAQCETLFTLSEERDEWECCCVVKIEKTEPSLHESHPTPKAPSGGCTTIDLGRNNDHEKRA